MIEEANKRNINLLRVAFADYLKLVAKNYYDWNGEKDEKGRQCLQNVARESRETHISCWVEVVSILMKILSKKSNFFVITDGRHKHEIDFLLNENLDNRFIVIRVERDDSNYSDLTISQQCDQGEIELDTYPYFDYILKSKTGLDNLKEATAKMINELGIFEGE